jgi:hypothetical protein
MPDYGFLAQGNDLMGTVGKVAAVQNQINQNKLFQGRQAAGEALQQSIDPSSGQIDFNTFNKLVQANPKIAPYAQEAVQNALVSRGQGITNTTGQTALQATYTQNLRKVIGSVPPGPNQGQQVISAIAKGAQMGLYPSDLAASFVGGQAMNDGTTIADLVKQATIANGEAAPMEAQFGTAGEVGTGGKNVAVDVNRVTGERTALGGDAASLQMTQTPGEKAQRVPFVDRGTGQPGTVAQSAITTDTGEPKAAPGVSGPNGELATGLAPGEAEAIAAPKGVQAQQAAELGKVYEGSVPRAAQLKELLAAQGDFRSGPGAAKWSGIVTEFNRIFGTNFSGDQAAAQQTFGKIAEQVAEAQRGAMGSSSTNAQTEAARIASPNTTYSPEANRRVIAMLLGNEVYIQTKQKAWQAFQQHGGKPSQYNAFVQQFNSHFDPRYFQEQYMTPDQKAEMYKAMKPVEQKRYGDARNLALSLDFGQ